MEPSSKILDGRYAVGDVLGRGGMGVVHRATDRRLGRDVAVKVLAAHYAADADARRRFEEEASAAARISHRAVVTVFDSGEDDGVAFLVMECLPGRTLADEMNAGPLHPERVRFIASEMVSALAAAHGVGIVHRDIKPSNVLLTADGSPKIGDFGIAKTIESVDLTSTGLVVGTTAYLAPERIAGAPATPATDLYSLGIVLYEALAGEKPFRGDNALAVAHAATTTRPSPLPERVAGLDPELTSIVQRAIAKDPEDRFRSAAEMLDALGGSGTSDATEAFSVTAPLAGQPAPTAIMPAPPPSEATPLLAAWHQRTSPNSRRLIGSAIAIVFAVLIVVLGYRWATDRTSSPPSAATTTTTTSATSSTSLPPALAGAIDELERAVNR